MSASSSEHATDVEAALAGARRQFCDILEQTTPGGLAHRLLTETFQQLEACVEAGRRLEERQWRNLRVRVATRWQRSSIEACQPRQQQLQRRRQLLSEQQAQLSQLLTVARQQLGQLTKPPTTDPLLRLQRKWARMCEDVDRETQERTEPRLQADNRTKSATARDAEFKPWNIMGLSLEELCDKQKLLRRSEQADEKIAQLEQMREAQYRPIADYVLCLRRFIQCDELIIRQTQALMKIRASVRLHAGWVRELQARDATGSQKSRPETKSISGIHSNTNFNASKLMHRATEKDAESSETKFASSDCEPSAELHHYDAALASGEQRGPVRPAGSTVGASDPVPLHEKLLYARLTEDETRRLVADAAERRVWYQVEFALAHDRLSLTSESVIALFTCCTCKGGKCTCNWTRLAVTAQRKVSDKPVHTRGWSWRRMQVAFQLMRLHQLTQKEDH